MSRKKLVVGAIALILLGCAMAVKALWFPAVQNVWFQLDYRQLRAAPGNLVVFRETLLGNRKAGCQTVWMGNRSSRNSDPLIRYSGRNVPLQEIIPFAYRCRPSDVVMSPAVPTNHYDFLVTVTKKPEEQLRQALERKTGLTADWQDQEADVWLLKVKNASAFKPSTNTAQRVEFKDGRLIFTHMPASSVIGFIGQRLERPLEDKTELSGFYDFSVSAAWINRQPSDEKTLKPLLDELGLAIVDGTATRRMLVVHRK